MKSEMKDREKGEERKTDSIDGDRRATLRSDFPAKFEEGKKEEREVGKREKMNEGREDKREREGGGHHQKKAA